MNRQYLVQMSVFVVILLVLNSLFQLHISIIGSLALTIVLSMIFSAMRR